MLGSLLCQLGAVVCSWDSPWRVQIVCDHGCCGWCGLSALCPDRLCPQVWLDNHAPIKSCKCPDCPRIPWFNQEIAKTIRLSRCLERVWYGDKSNMEALTLFHCQCQLMLNLPDKAEQKFFLTSTTENSSNYKCIYEICNHLLGRSKDSPLPPGISNKDLAVRFNNYFIEKIANICTDLFGKHQLLPPYVERLAPPGTHNFDNFKPVTLP